MACLRSKMWYSARQLGFGLLDLLYPPRCLTCEALAEPFCLPCRQEIEPAEDWPHPRALDAVQHVGLHAGPLRRAVLRLKFERKIALAEPLGDLLAQTLDEVRKEWRPDLLVPVPIHWTRRSTRGYNQSELLAQTAGTRLRLPSLPVLARARRTRHQIGLSPEQRAANVAGALRLQSHGHVAGQRVVVVDDVCTTGATLAACARVLRDGGAAAVFGLTVTREP